MQSVRPLRPFSPAEPGNGMEPSPSPLPNGGMTSATPPLSPPLSPNTAALASQFPGYSPLSPALLGQLMGSSSPNLANMMGGQTMYHPLQAQQAAAMYAALQQQQQQQQQQHHHLQQQQQQQQQYQPLQQQQYQQHLGMMGPQVSTQMPNHQQQQQQQQHPHHQQQQQQQPIILLGQHTDEQDVPQPKSSGKGKGKKGAGSTTAYASRHMAAEQRRRSRINERFERLRQIVPHCERANMASFLDVVIDYIQDLQTQVKDLQGQRNAEAGEPAREAGAVEANQTQAASGKLSETSTEGTKRSGGGFWDAEGFKEEGTHGKARVNHKAEDYDTEQPVQFYSGGVDTMVNRAPGGGQMMSGQKREAPAALPLQTNREESPDTPPLSPAPFAEVLAEAHFEEGDVQGVESSPKRTKRDH